MLILGCGSVADGCWLLITDCLLLTAHSASLTAHSGLLATGCWWLDACVKCRLLSVLHPSLLAHPLQTPLPFLVLLTFFTSSLYPPPPLPVVLPHPLLTTGW